MGSLSGTRTCRRSRAHHRDKCTCTGTQILGSSQHRARCLEAEQRTMPRSTGAGVPAIQCQWLVVGAPARVVGPDALKCLGRRPCHYPTSIVNFSISKFQMSPHHQHLAFSPIPVPGLLGQLYFSRSTLKNQVSRLQDLTLYKPPTSGF